MLSNNFKIAWRNIIKHKTFSFINITGLAVAMAASMLMGVWIWDEYNCDSSHENRGRIFEAYNRTNWNGEISCWNTTPMPMAKALAADYPEIEQTVRVYWPTEALFSYDDKKIKAVFNIVDSNFFKVFTFPLVAGDEKTCFNRVNSVVITKSLAQKVFGNDDPMDKTLMIDLSPYTVTGVVKDYTDKSRFQFDCLLPYSVMKAKGWDNDYWSNNSIMTYAMVKPNTNIDQLQSKIKHLRKKYDKDGQQVETFLYPMSRARLYGRFDNGIESGGRITLVKMLSIISVMILVIACINFMNLSTARSDKRSKEVGVRKVAGATKNSLIFQFLSESVVTSLIAFLFAVLLVKLSFSYFNDMAGKQLTFGMYAQEILGGTFLFALLSGFMAGSYPSWYLSGFNPVTTLKGAMSSTNALVTPRKILIFLQFACATGLIIATLIVHQQLNYVQDRDSGYDKQQLVYHAIEGDVDKNYTSIKQELLESGLATSVTKTSAPITEGWSNSDGMEWKGKSENEHTVVDRFCADEKVVRTLGFKLLAGRDFDLSEFKTDSSAMIINMSFAKLMGYTTAESALGQIVNDNGRDWSIIGVIEDFVLHSPFRKTQPLAIEGAHAWFNIIHVRYDNKKPMTETLAAAEKIFTKYNPEYPFNYKFVDDEYARKFSDARRIASISAFFAGLSIFISCLGLFGLVNFLAANRKKELAIRKVNGASVPHVLTIITKDFLLIIAISYIVAIPVTWHFMDKWLQSYSYKITFNWSIFLLTAVILLAITIVTISYQAIKAALANPISALRSE
jgi:ABC-type antimicrobial peptide transport system permease subunit